MEPQTSQERRLVTVLFADVTGSTALAESLDPEDVSALLERFFRIARESVENHGGTVEKFIGDAVVAVFGLPVAHGDDANRGAAAAIEIRDRVRSDSVLGERLPIRLGLNTGEVVATRAVAGDDATLGADGRFTGDSVNVAARLQQGSAVWGIVAGERTARAATGFAFGPLREIETKGKTAPVRAYELVGPRTEHARPLPIVGREADLAQLELVARRAFNERRPYLVSLVAPAGTGKTRLVEAFLDLLPAIAPSASVAIAQCLPYGQRMTYWPLRQMLHRLTGIDVDAPPDVARRDLVAWLNDLGANDPQRLGDAIAATIGLGNSETYEPTGLVAAWRSAVELAAARTPLLLVFEDLHWSSDSLLDLVEFVMQPRGDLPLVMVALTRPELLERRPAWGGGRRNHLSLELEPLDDKSVAALVENLLEAAPTALIDAVVLRSEGNPFYATEIVRSITERLGPEGLAAADEATLVGALPDTVQATVLSRLDGLPPHARHVLQVGAVFGRSFASGGVAAVEPALSNEIDGALDVLLERDLVRLSGGDDYTFRHMLIREVAYQTLTRVERARSHAAAGVWLEAHSGANIEAFAELIAFHCREAATLSTVLGGAIEPSVAERARIWLGRAADAALAAGANVEAYQHLLGAVQFADPEQQADLWVRIADAAATGEQAVPALETALSLGDTLGRSEAWRLRAMASLLSWQTRFHGSVPLARRYDSTKMMELVEHGRALMESTDDEDARAHFLVSDGFVPFWQDSNGLHPTVADAKAAKEKLQIGLEYARRVDDLTLASAALDGLCTLEDSSGNLERALAMSRERVAAAERLDIRELVDAQCMVAWHEARVGELRQAERGTAAALGALQPGQVPSWAAHLTSWRVYVLVLLGRWKDAFEAAERLRNLWIEVGRTGMGFASGGLLAGLMAARAARDERRVDEIAEVLSVTAKQYEGGPREAIYTDIFRETLTADPAELVTASIVGQHAVERWLHMATDAHHFLPAEAIEQILERSTRENARPLRIQALRARGLARSDEASLEEARSSAEEIGERPLVGRLDCEIGRLTGDRVRMEAGRAVLRDLGDLVALDRYE